jgi:DNA-binding MarR family transcriptional regulator
MHANNEEPIVSVEKLAARHDTDTEIPDDVAQFADSFVALIHAVKRTRSQLLAAAKHNVEWSANVIVACVINDGPIRASALAEMVQSDPSTISRQVAALVRDGLLERRADPIDGRASLLVTTARGEAAHRDQKGMRDEHFARMLADWSERDIRRFTALLRRFTDDYDRYRPQFFAEQESATGEQS